MRLVNPMKQLALLATLSWPLACEPALAQLGDVGAAVQGGAGGRADGRGQGRGAGVGAAEGPRRGNFGGQRGGSELRGLPSRSSLQGRPSDLGRRPIQPQQLRSQQFQPQQQQFRPELRRQFQTIPPQRNQPQEQAGRSFYRGAVPNRSDTRQFQQFSRDRMNQNLQRFNQEQRTGEQLPDRGSGPDVQRDSDRQRIQDRLDRFNQDRGLSERGRFDRDFQRQGPEGRDWRVLDEQQRERAEERREEAQERAEERRETAEERTEDLRERSEERRDQAEERREESRERVEDRAEERNDDRRQRDEDRVEEWRERAEEWRDDVFGDRRREYDGNRRERFDDGRRGRFDDGRRGRYDDDWSWLARRVQDFWLSGNRNELPFRFGWWDNYDRNRWPIISPWRNSTYRNRPFYWWSWTPAPRLTSWLVYRWNRPYYWDYGPGRNIYCRNDYVYYDGERVMPINRYYWTVYELAHDVPALDEREAEQMEWTPLGVFALIRENQSESYRALQIAVNRDGILSGTYYNQENGHVHPVTGRVDDRTQRAAWKFADGEHKDVVFETSIYNLTEPEATMMVHFGPDAGQPQVWRLVRLEQPEDAPSVRTSRQYDLP